MPFKMLSWEGLIFFLDRTDFSEPSLCGFGFATKVKELLLEAAKDRVKNDPIAKGVLEQIIKEKGLE